MTDITILNYLRQVFAPEEDEQGNPEEGNHAEELPPVEEERID